MKLEVNKIKIQFIARVKVEGAWKTFFLVLTTIALFRIIYIQDCDYNGKKSF